MKINIKATNIALTPALTDYLTNKLSHLKKFKKWISDEEESLICNVEVGKDSHHRHGDVFRAEVHLAFAGQSFYAVANGSDLYAAIDEVKDQITAEIESKTKKRNTLLRRGGRRAKALLRGLNPWSWRQRL